MPIVSLKESESFDVALRRFKRACEKAGILTKLRQLEYYEKPTSKRKRKRASAVKRYQKKIQKAEEAVTKEYGKRQKSIVIRHPENLGKTLNGA